MGDGEKLRTHSGYVFRLAMGKLCHRTGSFTLSTNPDGHEIEGFENMNMAFIFEEKVGLKRKKL